MSDDDVFGDGSSPTANDDDLRSIHEDEELNEENENMEDLFGDEGNDLEEGDPFGEDMDDDEADNEPPKHQRVLEMDVFRHRTPRTKDGRVQSFKVPKFLRFAPEPYDARTFEPSKTDLENARSENPRPTIRHYVDPETGELRSNARMYRWSDGSMSMSVGGEHYTVLKKPTAPDPSKPYDELKDGHNYAAAAHLDSSVFVIVGHMSEEYTVRQNKQHEDEALQRLAMRIREATSTHDNTIIKTTHDPEQQRRLAEQAEKEQAKQQRRRDTQMGRSVGGSGSRSGGGLGIDDLEGSKSRSRKRASGTSKPKRKSISNLYSDEDEEMGYGGGRGANDYDKEDDFIASSGDEEEAGSEEEEEILDDDDDEEEEEEGDRHRRKKRQKTVESDEEETHYAARRRRHVVEDDSE